MIFGDIFAFEMRFKTLSAAEQFTPFLRLYSADGAYEIQSTMRLLHSALLSSFGQNEIPRTVHSPCKISPTHKIRHQLRGKESPQKEVGSIIVRIREVKMEIFGFLKSEAVAHASERLP